MSKLLNCLINKDQVLKIPVAHNEGNFYCDDNDLKYLHDNELIAFEYCEGKYSNSMANINGSIDNIAGITNKDKNILQDILDQNAPRIKDKDSLPEVPEFGDEDGNIFNIDDIYESYFSFA